MAEQQRQEEWEVSLDTIVLDLGQSLAERIIKKVVHELRYTKACIPQEITFGLNTIWDEYCAQMQYGRFIEWPLYGSLVCSLVVENRKKLNSYELEALWVFVEMNGETDEEVDVDIFEAKVEVVDINTYLCGEIDEIAFTWENKSLRHYAKMIDY